MDPKMEPSPFATALSYILSQRKLRQGVLAERAGCSQAYLSSLLSGRTDGRWRSLEAIAAALGTTYVEMLQFGKQLQTGEAQAMDLTIESGYCRVLLPEWDQRPLSKMEEDYMEMALAVLRSWEKTGEEYALTLKQTIKLFHRGVTAKLNKKGGAEPRKTIVNPEENQ